jgi:putative transposase
MVGVDMKILRAYKTEIEPNNVQQSYLGRCAGAARFVFNWGLATWRFWYEDGKKPSEYSLRKHFTSIKDEQCPWIRELPYAVTEGAFYDLGNAFQNFFRRVKGGEEKAGYPKFKRRSGCGSFHLRNTRIEHDRVRLTGIGWIRLKERGYIPITGTCKQGVYATISERAGRWYIAIQVEEDIAEPEVGRLVVGIDLGLKTRVVLSNGEEIDAPKPYYDHQRQLARLGRELSRRKRGGQNWHKTNDKLAREHDKIANIRKHWLHQISHHIIYDLHPKTVVLENLNVSGMIQNRHLAKSVSDAGFYELRRQIEYKAQWAGVEVIIADTWYASSKTCSGCGAKKDVLALSERTFVCMHCGLVMDRDLNAARNLERLAA